MTSAASEKKLGDQNTIMLLAHQSCSSSNVARTSAPATEMLVRLLTILSLITIQHFCTSAAASDRVALVIGNAQYIHSAPLKNTKNDADDIAHLLRRLGFDVISGTNLDKRATEKLIREFDRKLEGARIGLFYYAGHGLQSNGQNYIVPIDASLHSEGDIDFETIPLELLRRRMADSGRASIIFIDACRDNPLARNILGAKGARSSKIGEGLAKMGHSDSAVGMLIGFATSPGKTAHDGVDRNSPYTAALLRNLDYAGRDLLTSLAVVRSEVMRQTNDQQVPWEESSLLGPIILRLPSGDAPTDPRRGDEGAVADKAVMREKCLEMTKSPWEVRPEEAPQGIFIDDIDEGAAEVCRAAVVPLRVDARLDYHLSRALRRIGSFPDGLKVLRAAASAQHPPAMFDYAMVQHEGRLTPRDDVEAVKWLRRSVAAGLPSAMNNLAVFLVRGIGGMTDRAGAERLFSQSKTAEAEWNIRLSNNDSLRLQGENPSATYCSADHLHNGNLLTGVNVSQVRPAGGSSSWSRNVRVVALGNPDRMWTISGARAGVVRGRNGVLYVFPNGAFAYNLWKGGESEDMFRYVIADDAGHSSALTLTLTGTTWYKNGHLIKVSGKGNGTSGDDVLASYDVGVDDEMEGGDGNDVLFAWSGGDVLSGGKGNDILFGEYGPDRLRGGADADVFVIEKSDVLGGYGGTFFDTIEDFSSAEGDVIDLTGIFADQPNARGNAYAHVSVAEHNGGAMIRVSPLGDGKWFDAVLVKGGLSEPLLKLVSEGSIVF